MGNGNYELLLTHNQLNKLGRAMGDVNIKFSKTQVKAMRQSGGNLGSILSTAIDWAILASSAWYVPGGLATKMGVPRKITRYDSPCS